MGPKPSTPKSNDLFRQRLDELVNPKHPLAQLAQHIDWSVFEHEWGDFFPSGRGRPATAPRLVAGLMYLQHTFALSDEEVVWGWVENPYWQLFCGETWFQHNPPIDPSSLTRWRQRIGAGGMEWLLAQTIRAAASAKVIKRQSLNKVIVDSPGESYCLSHRQQASEPRAGTTGEAYGRSRNHIAPELQPCRSQARRQDCPLRPCQTIQAHAQSLKEAQDRGRPCLARRTAPIVPGDRAPQA